MAVIGSGYDGWRPRNSKAKNVATIAAGRSPRLADVKLSIESLQEPPRRT
jgi:hypothetical protein